jgi:hypothetical protein
MDVDMPRGVGELVRARTRGEQATRHGAPGVIPHRNQRHGATISGLWTLTYDFDCGRMRQRRPSLPADCLEHALLYGLRTCRFHEGRREEAVRYDHIISQLPSSLDPTTGVDAEKKKVDDPKRKLERRSHGI